MPGGIAPHWLATLALVGTLLLTACSGLPTTTPTVAPTPTPRSVSTAPAQTPTPVPTQAPAAVPAFDHIYVIVMENKDYWSVVGNPNTPYTQSLIDRYGLATNYSGVSHPSEPNYFALWSGSTQGATTDDIYNFNARTVADQLDAQGKSWRVYAENVPVTDANGQPTCFAGATANGGPDGPGTYARKHEPAISFSGISSNPRRCQAHITDFSHFDPAAANFNLIVPNLCHDTHDCAIGQGDAWLSSWLPSHILDTPTWRTTNSVVFLTWDEGSSTSGAVGQIATIVISPKVQPAFQSDVAHNHYSLLRTVEDAWRLGCLANSCNANDLREFFTTAP